MFKVLGFYEQKQNMFKFSAFNANIAAVISSHQNYIYETRFPQYASSI